MSDLIAINVVIGDRTYRLKVETKDEEIVRGTVKLINDKILEFRSQFAGKDMQDYISMVLLWFATEQTKTGNTLQSQEVVKAIDGLEKLLSGIQ
jgi:cell division protein ZapA (FtsZ GTPase activity inhibitor)